MGKSEEKGRESRLLGQTSSMFDVVLVCLIVLVGSVMGLVWYGYQSNTSAIFNLSDSLIKQINSTVKQKTKEYLVPAPIMTELGSRITGDQIKDLSVDSELSQLMLETLKLHDQLMIFSIGKENGEFMMHMKQPDGTIWTKMIERPGGEPELYWYERNKDGALQARRQEPFDGYDPRVRPWYKGAKKKRGRYWTDVYIFHTSQEPGITASFPIITDGKVVGAFGLDIPLTDLSDFVAKQRIGDNGATFLINDKDQLIAAPGKTALVMGGSGEMRPKKVAEYEHPALEKAWKKKKETGKKRISVEIEGKRWIASFQELTSALQTRSWTTAVLVPEADLIGPIQKTNQYRLAVSLSVLFAALVAGAGLRRIKNMMDMQSRFIRRTFGRYLSDDIVTAILESPEGLELGGEKRTVTILMTDLRGFTAMSERLPAEEVVGVLNEFLGDMAEIIMKWDGTIDEFIGDAILAIFGAPFSHDDDAQRAVACGLEMQRAMEKVNKRNREKGYPELAMGIGINTGEVVVGNVGSWKRTKYGIVGQNVNLTARIESYTVGSQVMISQATREACGDLLTIEQRLEVTPKGVAKPITIFEVRGIGGEYDMEMPESEVALKYELDPAIEAGLAVLDGKQAGGTEHTCRMVALDLNMECEVEADMTLALHENVKLHVAVDGREADLYGKVTGKDPSSERRTIVLTSVPPKVENALRARLGA